MSDRNDAPETIAGKKKSALPLVIGLPLIAVVAAAAIFFTSTGQNSGERASEAPSEETPSGETPSGEAPSETPSEAPSESAEVASDGESENAEGGASSGFETPSLGEADAPVVMSEFSDYQ